MTGLLAPPLSGLVLSSLVLLPLGAPALTLAQTQETAPEPPAPAPAPASEDGKYARDGGDAEDAGDAPLTARVLELTLDDALRIALERNLSLELEALNTEIARFDYLGSWGAFDPVLRASGTLIEADSEPSSIFGGGVQEFSNQSFDTGLLFPFETGGTLDLSYSHSNDRTTSTAAVSDTSTTDVLAMALTQPLLRGGWKRFATSNQRQAEIELRSRELREREIRQQVMRDVTNAYWDLVGAFEELGVREVALRTGVQQLEQNKRRLDVGVGTEVDVLQSETNVAQLEEERLLAESNLRAAEDALRSLLFQRAGHELLEAATAWDWPIVALTPLPEVSEEPLPSWLVSLDRALQSRPELAQQRLAIETSEVLLERSRSLRLPQLDLRLSAESRGFDATPSDAFDEAVAVDFPTYVGSLDFSLPLPNRSARYAERAAEAAVRAARISYEQTEVTVLAEVRDAVRSLLYAGENVAAARTSSEFARRQLAAEEARYQEGLSTTFQVLEFQRDLAEAMSTLTTARAGYAKALVELRYAEGELIGPASDAEARPLAHPLDE